MKPKKNFADRLKIYMITYNIKQVDMAKKLNIPKSSLSMYLRGDREPRQDKLTEIADILGVSEVWLHGYDVPMKFEEEMLTSENAELVVDMMSDEKMVRVAKKMLELNESQFTAVEKVIDSMLEK